ncbi:MAG: glycerol-3-phosphate 1-O-acyltransferase PlsY [Candidatus Firestonebacteria bacterium]|nr:glycerol-3-phosphate 1-O-acyltransferase PlsY [Candidatus Firestonebacteria bacterium]
MANEFARTAMALIASYLIGSIPFSFLIGKVFYSADIRQLGSRNVGATNVFRVLGKKAGVFAMLLDAGKGFFAILIVPKMLPEYAGNILDASYYQVLCGIFAVIGHNWTVFLKFKGGKGVATSIGVALGLVPLAAGIAVLSFVTLLFISKYVSVSSMISSVIFFAALLFFREAYPLIIFGGLACLMIIIRHIPNIKRLIKGTENKLWQKKLQ